MNSSVTRLAVPPVAGSVHKLPSRSISKRAAVRRKRRRHRRALAKREGNRLGPRSRLRDEASALTIEIQAVFMTPGKLSLSALDA